MRWPWTSVARLEDANRRTQDALEQVEYLREEIARLTDHVTRVSRREAGLPEVPRAPREPMQPMPAELRAYFGGLGNKRLRHEQMNAAFRRHARNEPWESIMKDVMPTEAEEPANA